MPASTSTTAPGAAACGLASAAFCETFDAPHPVAGTRTGDLDPELWGVSRIHSQSNNNGDYNQWYKAVGYTGDALTTPVPGCAIGSAPNDVRVCDGRMIEAVNDHGLDAKTMLATYPKQPFNFAGRTGTIVFDVSADAAGNHAAWPELWITDQPVPAPGADDHAPPRNGLQIIFNGSDGCLTRPSEIRVVKNYVAQPLRKVNVGPCVAMSSAGDANLNHVRVTVSASLIQVFMTDPGSTDEKLVTTLTNPDFDPAFVQGLVWLSDAHYNACKFDLQCDHAFAWDNLGFDGPKTYRDLAFDVPDNTQARSDGGVNLGYFFTDTKTFTVTGVHHGNKTPTGAYVLFNTMQQDIQEPPTVKVNGGAVVTQPWHPASDGAYNVETWAFPIDPTLVVDGNNTITFTTRQGVIVSNIDLVLVAAQSVP